MTDSPRLTHRLAQWGLNREAAKFLRRLGEEPAEEEVPASVDLALWLLRELPEAVPLEAPDSQAEDLEDLLVNNLVRGPLAAQSLLLPWTEEPSSPSRQAQLMMEHLRRADLLSSPRAMAVELTRQLGVNLQRLLGRAKVPNAHL